MKKILGDIRDNESAFRVEVDRKVDHYCGHHKLCDVLSLGKSCKELPVMPDGEGKKQFMVKIQQY